jgi:ribonuclease T2
MKRQIFSALICLLVLSASVAWARKKHRHAASSAGEFDYYLLALSWAPNYCAEHPSDHSSECMGHATFVLHGLWPQAAKGAPPMDCDGGRVSSATVDHMLQFMPSRGLIQHEWSKHGTCSGLSADNYFRGVERAFTSVQVPDAYRHLTHDANVSLRELEQSFATANGAPPQAFRTSCHSGELVGLEICLDKDLGYRACSSSARECSSSSVTVRAPR